MSANAPAIDAITLEVLRNALQSVAEEMGAVLKRTSFSPNIKERMDASCAIFDPAGALVAQAEHVPIHLGSMLRAIADVIAAAAPVEEGDVILVNDPFLAGAHLPDVTMLAPVHVDGELIAFVADRAHHADVGGMEPGSMPGNSGEIFQEGLIIPAVKLYRGGALQDDVMALVLANVRTPEERRGDLNAQLSALRIGQRRLAELAGRHGPALLQAGLAAVLDYAERRLRARIAALPDGRYQAEDFLDDDGLRDEPVAIRVAVTIAGDRLGLDFTGSAPQRPGNINAVAPMTWSASLFALKLVTDPDIPVNGGSLRAIELILPEDSVVNARAPAAVCAGNTETTQRICDTVLRAAAGFAPERTPAASQGTMNLIGVGGRDPRSGRPFTYIETIAGGEGARPWGDGTDGVQVNMTNTMNTPVEALEISYPLRVTRYEFRPGSGGDGRWRGGLGLVRAVEAVGTDVRVSLSAERRIGEPWGLAGGAAGARGRNAVLACDGRRRDLPGKVTFDLAAGETVLVETPGGGGWGDPATRSDAARARDRRDGRLAADDGPEPS